MPKRKAEDSKVASDMRSFSNFLSIIERARRNHGKDVLDFKFNKQRVRVLSKKEDLNEDGEDIVYWMSRDQRVQDNWALLYAQRLALKAEKPLSICFSLPFSYQDATLRAYNFIIEGLKEVEKESHSLKINFHLLLGEPKDTIPKFVSENNISAVVCDFSPLREFLKSVDDVRKKIPDDVPMCQVDSHNIVPCWITSEKLEYAARTIRPKIWRHMDLFFTGFPPVVSHPYCETKRFKQTDWDKVYSEIDVDETVKPVDWAKPGTESGLQTLFTFITERLENYSADRNNPNKLVLSNLSPWFHFGQISVQRSMLEVNKFKSKNKESVDAFLEEGIVRRELSDNFCYYQKKYDSLEGAWDWAIATLQAHDKDKRKYVYSLKKFETAKTHEDLWNAAQRQLVNEGKLHGFLRMYWAKKILEWSENSATALKIALYLNDKYSLDGRDPNGFVGCMWSIGGIHDQGWRERDIFGKIRYMNYEGCKRKFDVSKFVGRYNPSPFVKTPKK